MLKSYRYSGKSFIKLNSLQKSILKIIINNINGKDLKQFKVLKLIVYVEKGLSI